MSVKGGRIPETTLKNLRNISCERVLKVLDLDVYSKKDIDFKPKLNKETVRVYVHSSKFEGELIITGPKFFSADLDRGGCGAIDLLMFLETVNFREAVLKLKDIFNV
jgi:hypothetical protein